MALPLRWWALAGLLAATPTNLPSQSYKELLSRYRTERKRYFAAKRQAEGAQARAEAAKLRPDLRVWRDRFMRVVTRSKNQDRLDAIEWVFRNDPSDRQIKVAGAHLDNDHINSERVGDICGRLGKRGSLAAVNLYRTLALRSPHARVQADCLLLEAQSLQLLIEEVRRQQEAGRGALVKRDAAALHARATKVLAKLINAHGSLKHYLGSYADIAKREQHRLRFLLGCEAPEITGQDVDGSDMRLGQYRGKVILLEFWGDW